MRNFINIVESAQPTWFANGRIVDITDDRWDAEPFLFDDEWDYEWRLCMVPTELVRDNDFVSVATQSETPEERTQAIQNWVSTHGGDFTKALTERPPLRLLTSYGELVSLDGYHRTNLAARAGLKAIPMLVAIGDPSEE